MRLKLALALLLASSLSAAPRPSQPAKSAAPTPHVTSAAPTGPTTIQQLTSELDAARQSIARLQLVADVAELRRLSAALESGFPHYDTATRAQVLKQFPQWAASQAANR